MDRSLKFCIKEVKGLYYLCSENKGADQLHGYREADLRLCFRICKNPFFSRRGSYDIDCKIEFQAPVQIAATAWVKWVGGREAGVLTALDFTE